jgi:uncharacterized protein (TIGR02217 family)
MVSVFPTTSFPGLTFPIMRTPQWRTILQESIGGVVTPQAPWTYPRYQYELPFSFFRQAAAYAELQTILGFYNQMYGQTQAFLYVDPNDSVVTSSQTIAVADGGSSSFQLLRTYGGFTEPVFGISTSSTTLTNATITIGSTVLSTAAFTISNKGVLTPSSIVPAGQTISWNGTFGWYCRFDADQYQFEQFTGSSDYQGPLWSLGKLTFTTIKFGA